MEGVPFDEMHKVTELFQSAEDNDNIHKLVYAKDDLDRTPLQICAYYGSINMARFIVEYWKSHDVDLEIDRKDKEGYTALFLTCIRGFTNQIRIGDTTVQSATRHLMVKLLLEQGADPNFVVSGTKMTPLHWACYYQDFKSIEHLCDKGAELKFDF